MNVDFVKDIETKEDVLVITAEDASQGFTLGGIHALLSEEGGNPLTKVTPEKVEMRINKEDLSFILYRYITD